MSYPFLSDITEWDYIFYYFGRRDASFSSDKLYFPSGIARDIIPTGHCPFKFLLRLEILNHLSRRMFPGIVRPAD